MLTVLDRVAGAARRRQHALHAAPPEPARDVAERAREVLAVRYGERLSLPDLARAIECSPFYLARSFRKATGTSLYRHRTELRLRAALDRLGDAKSGLLDLALALGYSSHSYFTDVFRSAFGVTPSEARQRLTRGHGRPLAAVLAAGAAAR